MRRRYAIAVVLLLCRLAAPAAAADAPPSTRSEAKTAPVMCVAPAPQPPMSFPSRVGKVDTAILPCTGNPDADIRELHRIFNEKMVAALAASSKAGSSETGAQAIERVRAEQREAVNAYNAIALAQETQRILETLLAKHIADVCELTKVADEVAKTERTYKDDLARDRIIKLTDLLKEVAAYHFVIGPMIQLAVIDPRLRALLVVVYAVVTTADDIIDMFRTMEGLSDYFRKQSGLLDRYRAIRKEALDGVMDIEKLLAVMSLANNGYSHIGYSCRRMTPVS